MARPIHKLWLVRHTEAWYQLSEEERNSLAAKVTEYFEKVGGKMVVMCDAAWSSEQFEAFGVEVFPDAEAIQKHTEDLLALNWFRYIESTSVLGTTRESS